MELVSLNVQPNSHQLRTNVNLAKIKTVKSALKTLTLVKNAKLLTYPTKNVSRLVQLVHFYKKENAKNVIQDATFAQTTKLAKNANLNSI
jgi:hypothetical protein